MRTTIKYLAAATLAALSIVSCNKNETEAPVSHETHFILNASSPQTKTGILYDGGSYLPYFQKGDEIGLFVNALPGAGGDMSTNAVFENTADDGDDAQFEGTLEVDPGDVTFYSFYPATAGKKVYVNNDVVTFGLDIPQIQHPAYDDDFGYTFDPKADLLIAKPATTTVDASNNAAAADIYFARLSAVLRVAINAGTSSEVYGKRVKSLKIETSSGHIAGRVVVNPLTGECTGVNQVGGSTAIEAVIDDPDACSTYIGYDGSNNIFLGVAPVTIPEGANVTFTINTVSDSGQASHKIVKLVENLGSAIVFESSKPTVINLTINDSEIGDPDPVDETNYSGEWVIAGTQTKDYVLSQFVSGNVYPAVEVSSIDSENEVVTVFGSKAPYKLTIAKVASGDYAGLYTIKDAGDKYLTATGGTSNNYLAGVSSENLVAGSYWSIAKTEGVLDIIATKVDESYAREIRVNYNSGNARFSCYKASSTQPKVGLYPYAKVVEALVPAATPVISCDNNTITITCATAGASIYYTLGTTEGNTADPTNESSLYDAENKPTIAADAYIKAIAVADGYDNSAIAGQALTYQDASTVYYVKVTEAPDDWSGQYLIVSGTKAFTGEFSGASPNYGMQEDVTVSEDKIVSTATVNDYAVTIAKSGSYYSIETVANGFLSWTSGNSLNHTTSVDGDNQRWSLTYSSGNVVIANANTSDRKLQYNSGSPRFACYTSSQQAIQLYKLVDNRDYAPISWPNAAETATKVGSTITWGNGSAPVLSNTESLDVTYESSDESVATIASDGTITVVGGGSTTITASYTGTTYKDTDVQFTLTVTDNTTYTITCNSNNNSYGTVSADVSSAMANATVTLTISANEGYKLSSISAVDASSNPVSLTSVDATHRTFTMPASNVTVSAVFDDSSTGGTVNLDEDGFKTVINASAHAYSDNEATYTYDGATWKVRGNSGQNQYWLQIRSDSTPSYIGVTAPGNIKKVTIKVSNASNTSGGINDISKHGAFTGTLSLVTAISDGTTVGSTNSITDNIAVITPTGSNSTLYITASKPARIWDVLVEY